MKSLPARIKQRLAACCRVRATCGSPGRSRQSQRYKARAQQDDPGNGDGEKTVRGKFFTHGAPQNRPAIVVDHRCRAPSTNIVGARFRRVSTGPENDFISRNNCFVSILHAPAKDV
jgi:hypothetical protein